MKTVCIILVFILTTSFEAGRNRAYGLTTVVIDAGHGGHDSGCLGKKSKEKDIALGIALKLGKYIEDNYPDVKVIYTRKTDQFVELHQRAEIANNAKADLFICIHCNSACVFDKKKKKEICNTQISGVESWVMGLNKTEENLEVSKRENEVILLEKDYTRQYGGFDPNSPEANIIFSLYQNTYLDQSLRMASFVQQEMKSHNRPGRGVKQAGFLVLYKTSMPSILIETGFLSNPDEENFLMSASGQDKMAQSIYSAFRSYKNSVETQKSDDRTSSDDKEVKKKSQEPARQDEPEEKVQPAVKETVKTAFDTARAELKSDSMPVLKQPEKENPKNPFAKNPGDVLQWSVQFYTSPKPLADNSKIYESFDDVREDFENGLYKYSTGRLPVKSEAIKLQTKIRSMGYKDAFVVAFFNDKKISIREANERAGQQ